MSILLSAGGGLSCGIASARMRRAPSSSSDTMHVCVRAAGIPTAEHCRWEARGAKSPRNSRGAATGSLATDGAACNSIAGSDSICRDSDRGTDSAERYRLAGSTVERGVPPSSELAHSASWVGVLAMLRAAGSIHGVMGPESWVWNELGIIIFCLENAYRSTHYAAD